MHCLLLHTCYMLKPSNSSLFLYVKIFCNLHSFIHSFAGLLKTVPQPFQSQYYITVDILLSIHFPNNLSFPCGPSLTSIVIFLVDPSILFSFNNLFQTSVSTDGVTSQVCLRLFIMYIIFPSSLSLYNTTYFISYAIVPNDLLHLSAAPRFRPFQVIIIYFPQSPHLARNKCTL